MLGLGLTHLVGRELRGLGANLGLGLGLGLGLINQLLGLGLAHLVGRELGGLAAVVRAVELVAARVVGGSAAFVVAEAPAR